MLLIGTAEPLVIALEQVAICLQTSRRMRFWARSVKAAGTPVGTPYVDQLKGISE